MIRWVSLVFAMNTACAEVAPRAEAPPPILAPITLEAALSGTSVRFRPTTRPPEPASYC